MNVRLGPEIGGMGKSGRSRDGRPIFFSELQAGGRARPWLLAVRPASVDHVDGGSIGLDKNRPLRCDAPRVKLQITTPSNGVPQREVQMGWLIPACMLAMVIISAVTLTRL
ncbi:hypothetical protein LMG27198_26800 [Methylocystis echinoides]|uniref:Uncharacterized protein n=1 Tax=Methylocystis echinoides TaxID=29468 RepID=A0A9W6GV52_9HYPH|nr:hypothetical protein LMG27198_26800 [Methylocystis echinoides]